MKRWLGAAALVIVSAMLGGQTAAPAASGPVIEHASGLLTADAVMRAEQHLHFAGTLLINGQQSTRVQQDGADRLRQEFLGPDGQLSDLVVSDGQIRWHWMPRIKTVRVSPMEPDEATLDLRLSLIHKNYRFQVMGQTRQAGRVVLLTQFTPLHRGNLVHRLWVDFETHLPLVVERRGEDGSLVDRSEYTSIDYKVHFDPHAFRFQIPEGAHVESTITVLAHGDGNTPQPKGMTFHPELPRALPEGYALMSWRYFLSNTQVPTFNWSFHDGLNMLSLFATAAEQAAKLPPDARTVTEGKLAANLLESHGSRMLTWKARGMSYTLVGHLPTNDLVQVALSTL